MTPLARPPLRRRLAGALAALAALAPLAASAAPAPYSLPWQLRPAMPVNVARLDTSVAVSHPQVGVPDTVTTASMFLLSYKVTPSFAPLVRLGVVHNAPGAGDSGTAFVNPVLGGTYGIPLSDSLRLAFFLGLTVPVGMGGGDTPDAKVAAAARSGILARSAMDNAMFAVNDFTVFPGVEFAYVQDGLTVQAEATVLQLTRVRGEAVQADSSRTNFTAGVHVGYFVASWLSLGAEVRHQRWLSTPTTVTTDALRDNTTGALGARFHVKLSDTLTLRPGLSYTLPFDAPMKPQHYGIAQLDLPLNF